MRPRRQFNYKILILVIVLVIVAFFGGMIIQANLDEADVLTVGDPKGFHINIPGFSQKREITLDEIRSTLKAIEEFSTYQSEYNVKKSAEETRYFLESIKIPLTTNKIAIDCKGIIKVGYDLNTIKISIDDEKKVIYVILPEPKINDNYIVWDSVDFNEVNNILNPIEFGQYKTLFEEIEAEGEKLAVQDGILQKAEENLKKIISGAFLKFRGYTVDFGDGGQTI